MILVECFWSDDDGTISKEISSSKYYILTISKYTLNKSKSDQMPKFRL